MAAAAVADRFVPGSPRRQARGDVVFVGMDQAVRGNGRRDQRLQPFAAANPPIWSPAQPATDRISLLRASRGRKIPQNGQQSGGCRSRQHLVAVADVRESEAYMASETPNSQRTKVV